MAEFDLPGSRIVAIVVIPVALFHPFRLLRELFGRLQIVGIEFLRADIVIGIRIPHISRALLFFGGNPVLIPLVENVAGPNRGNCKQRPQYKADSLFCFWAQHAVTISNAWPGGACPAAVRCKLRAEESPTCLSRKKMS